MGIFKKQRTMDNYFLPADEHPLCPHCEHGVKGLMSRQIETNAGRAYVWVCPHCRKILGVGHRSGYVLG